jgi:hypothetical protein
MSKRTNSNTSNGNGYTSNGSRTIYVVIDGKRVPRRGARGSRMGD